MSKFYECNPVFFTIFTRQGNDISFFCKFNIVIGAKTYFLNISKVDKISAEC